MSTELHNLIEKQRELSFRPEVRDSVPDTKVCGVLLAHHFKWNAVDLLEVAAAALEDANFAAEAERVRAIFDEQRASEYAWIRLTS